MFTFCCWLLSAPSVCLAVCLRLCSLILWGSRLKDNWFGNCCIVTIVLCRWTKKNYAAVIRFLLVSKQEKLSCCYTTVICYLKNRMLETEFSLYVFRWNSMSLWNRNFFFRLKCIVHSLMKWNEAKWDANKSIVTVGSKHQASKFVYVLRVFLLLLLCLSLVKHLIVLDCITLNIIFVWHIKRQRNIKMTFVNTPLFWNDSIKKSHHHRTASASKQK